MNYFTYYHTLKYLKISQIVYRIRKRFIHPTHHCLNGCPAMLSGDWVTYGLYEQKLFDGNRVRFLNVYGVVHSENDWNDVSQSKLWLYNLHYFDDLCAVNARNRIDQQVALIHKWITDNPAPEGNGWEPYPASLRIVNWIKFFLSGISPDKIMLDSLAQQVDFLSQDLERHLLGNHLFVNAKSLIFAGLFLEGKPATKWLETGLKIYDRELEEQVLSDGGNFELAPMYHVIMLVDLLDLTNIFTAYSHKIDLCVIDKTRKYTAKMLDWLQKMTHTDGEVSFFNDTAFGIAPKNSVVTEYAKKLGLKPIRRCIPSPGFIEVFDLESSGYVSARSFEYSLVADLSPVGPDYIPGHAHADTLSFEFSLGGQRVFVNSGISEYGLSEERLRQRQTAAHNTVSVNGMDSSHVWSGFRVAQRARVADRVVGPVVDNTVSFGASHNGFKQQGVNCVHHRKWNISPDRILFTDKIIGRFESAIGYLHLHPEVDVLDVNDEIVKLATDRYLINLAISGATVFLADSTWHPQFGVSNANKKLYFQFKNDSMAVVIDWRKK